MTQSCSTSIQPSSTLTDPAAQSCSTTLNLAPFEQMVAMIVCIGYETGGDLDEAVRIYSERHNVLIQPSSIEKIRRVFEAEFYYEYDTTSAAAQA